MLLSEHAHITSIFYLNFLGLMMNSLSDLQASAKPGALLPLIVLDSLESPMRVATSDGVTDTARRHQLALGMDITLQFMCRLATDTKLAHVVMIADTSVLEAGGASSPTPRLCPLEKVAPEVVPRMTLMHTAPSLPAPRVKETLRKAAAAAGSPSPDRAAAAAAAAELCSFGGGAVTEVHRLEAMVRDPHLPCAAIVTAARQQAQGALTDVYERVEAVLGRDTHHNISGVDAAVLGLLKALDQHGVTTGAASTGVAATSMAAASLALQRVAAGQGAPVAMPRSVDTATLDHLARYGLTWHAYGCDVLAAESATPMPNAVARRRVGLMPGVDKVFKDVHGRRVSAGVQ